MTLVAQKSSDIYQRFRRLEMYWQFAGEDKQRAKLTDFVRRLSPHELELAVGDAHESLRNMAGFELKVRQDHGQVPHYRPGEVRARWHSQHCPESVGGEMSKPQMEIQLTYPKGTTSEQLIEALELWIQGIRSGKESLGRGNNLDVVELERMYKL